MKSNAQFDIKVALVGYVSVGKSTVLNALLGDKFSQVALNRTTAGINFFRIDQPSDQEEQGTASSGVAVPEVQVSKEKVVSDDDEQRPSPQRKYQQADAIYKEIEKDNNELRSSEKVTEKTFDIQVKYPICKMRKDATLVLIDIPGINEAESSKKYKDYVESNWKTFDCVVVVMDAIQGVNTEEQVDLLKFVEQNNRLSKKLPTIVLGNKMDDLEDEDTIHLIEETLSKTIDIFGNVDCRSIPHRIKSEEDDSTSTTDTSETPERTTTNDTTNPEATANTGAKTAFIPLSAKNAFTYMKAGSLDADELNDPKHRDLINKIGSDEYGRKWTRMKGKERINAVSEILKDPAELDDRLAGTNFTSFLTALSEFVGGDDRQREILMDQVDIDLKNFATNFATQKEFKGIGKFIFQAFQRCKSIGRTDSSINLQETFWKVYQNYEDEVFGPYFETYANSRAIASSFTELEQYYEVASALEWDDEMVKTIDKMKQLIRRQLTLVLKKIESWNFESYCLAAGGKKIIPARHTTRCSYCHSSQKCSRLSPTKRSKYPSYFECGSNAQMEWKNGWKHDGLGYKWTDLSPHDWMVILDSLSLAWNQNSFLEAFGPERVKLYAASMNFRFVFGSFFGMDFESSRATDAYHRICLHAYREQMRKDVGELTTLQMPDSLTDPSHWGYLSWMYAGFCEDLVQHQGSKKRKAPITSNDAVIDLGTVSDVSNDDGKEAPKRRKTNAITPLRPRRKQHA